LTGQLGAMQTVRSRIDASRRDLDAATAALVQNRSDLAQLVARRGELTGRLLRDDGKGGDADQASDLFDLIKRADADNERRDKELAARPVGGQPSSARASASAADPTKPKMLRAFDAPRAQVLLPVDGDAVHRFGEADPNGRPSQGLTLNALPGGVVVAPFDGRIDYAANFHDGGLILIIRHGAGYHSLLAGLGRVDVKPGQWVLAGEPVGALPESEDKGARAMLQFELRREGRPVDPQSRLAMRDDKTGDSKVAQ
jgi:septal ring factor EnvC (AmiA/AmiB activator)